jgi:hypothetical protein
MNFQFVAEVYGRNVDGLSMVQVQNLNNTPYRGQLWMKVTENNSHNQVIQVLTPVTVFNPGVTILPKTVFYNSSFTFPANSWAAIANQTRSFAPGEYSFCFQFVPQDKSQTDAFENCFDASIQPMVPLSLLVPANGDSICNKRPLLSWQPPLPYTASMRFRLLLVEKKKAQAAESIMADRPLLLLDNISGNSINYPSSYPELVEGKTYCWQVVAYQAGVIISKSEIWEFTVQCTEKAPPVPNDSYRELKLLMNGNYYFADYYLKFSFSNPYSVTSLPYTITDVAHPEKKITRLSPIKLKMGLNQIDLDLSDAGLEPGQHYILKVIPFNESPIEVRFIYQEH